MEDHGVPEDSYAPTAKDVQIAELKAEVARLRADYLNADRKAAMNAQEAGEHLAEVERLREELAAKEDWIHPDAPVH